MSTDTDTRHDALLSQHDDATTTRRTAGGAPVLFGPADVAAACDMDPADLATLAALCRKYAKKYPQHDAADVAQVASMIGARLALTGDHALSVAAAVACRTAAHRYTLRRAYEVDAAAAGSLTDEDRAQAVKDAESAEAAGRSPLAQPVIARNIDPARIANTTNASRLADALAECGADDEEARTVVALLSADWKGGKAPAAAVRRALNLPPTTGRAGVAWSAEVAQVAARYGITTTATGKRCPIASSETLPGQKHAGHVHDSQCTTPAGWDVTLTATSPLADAWRALLIEHAQGTEQWQPTHYGTPRLRRAVPADYADDAAALAQPTAYPATPARLRLVRAEGPALPVFVDRAPAPVVVVAQVASPERVDTWQTVAGEVAVTRLTWQRVTTTTPVEGPAHRTTTPGAHPVAYVAEDQAHDTARTTTDTRRQDRPSTSGPASLTVGWSQRQADRLGILDNGQRRKATAEDRAQVLDIARTLPTTLPAHREGTERQERQDFDHEAAAAPTGARIPGVSVDAEGVAVAGSGLAGKGSGSGKAAQRKPASRKSSRSGSTGPTVPVTLSR